MNNSSKQNYRNKMFKNKIAKKLVNLHNVVELLDFVKQKYKYLPAVVQKDGTTTKSFYDLYNDVLTVASNLVSIKGNIGLFLENSYEFEVVVLATMAIGKMAVCLPYSLPTNKLQFFCQKFDVKELCVNKSITGLSDIKQITTDLLFNDKKEKIKLDSNNIKDSQPACLLLTGGTTGIPKGVVLSHTAIMRGMINGCYGLSKIYNQRYYCMIPLTHSFGFVRNMLTALYTGSLIYYNLNKANIFKEMIFFKPTTLILVPALASLFLRLIKTQTPAILGGCVNTIICGSANVPSSLPSEFAKFHIGFYPGYGLTELANLVSGNMFPTKFPQSVGLLFPEQKAKIVEGELWLKGRNLMNGYYKDPIANKDSFKDDWFKTGDLAKFDQWGNLYIVGRVKDIIVLSNGEKISCAYIESKILTINEVQDALVYLYVNKMGAQYLIAEVTIRPEICDNINDIDKYLWKKIQNINSQELLPCEQITKLIIRKDDFERTPSMKIIRKKIVYE